MESPGKYNLNVILEAFNVILEAFKLSTMSVLAK